MLSSPAQPGHAPALLLAVAVQAARRAGDYALARRERRQETLAVARHDIKLALDVECQNVAAGAIAAVFPEHDLLGEEGEGSASTSGWNWVVDPIDGTVNFSHGQPRWCCSVAARFGEKVLAGAVYAPELGLLFEAAADAPALCNGQVIEPSLEERLEQALVYTGADKEAAADSEPFRFFNRIAAEVMRPRISGSAALDICDVARGAADAYFEPGVYLWDIAAAGLIVERAGGVGHILKSFSGQRLAYLAANGNPLFESLRERVTTLF